MQLAWGFLALLVVTLGVLALVWLGRSIEHPQGGFFRNWQAAVKAFKQAESRGERLVLVLLTLVQGLRAGLWGTAGVMAVAGYAAAASIFGQFDPADVFKTFRAMLQDLYDFILRLRAPEQSPE